MTELLEQAIARLKTLPANEQNAIAAIILAELEDEQAWTSRFQAPTDEQWGRLAAMVRQDIANGKTVPLEDVFLS